MRLTHITRTHIQTHMYTSDEVPDGRNAAPPDSSACEGGFPHTSTISHSLAMGGTPNAKCLRVTSAARPPNRWQQQQQQQQTFLPSEAFRCLSKTAADQKTAFLTIRRQSGEFGSPSPHSPSLLCPLTGFPRRPRASS